MLPQRRNDDDPRIEDSATRPFRRERARERLDRKLDQALECTFPASDPFDLSSVDPVSRGVGDDTTPKEERTSPKAEVR
jgi:hypothetical protein